MFQIYIRMCSLHWLWIRYVIVKTLEIEGGNLLKDLCLLQEAKDATQRNTIIQGIDSHSIDA